jgi:hypothetical protein
VVRSVNTYAVMILGTLWAILLVVGGSLLPTSGAWNDMPAMRPVLLVGGFTAVVAGCFVFVVIVADRLFPHVEAHIAMWTEIALAGLFLSGIAATITVMVGMP